MSATPATLTVRIGQPLLRLDRTLASMEDLAKIRQNLSCLALEGDDLWLGGDEGTCIDRMKRDVNGDFSRHARFDLGSFLDLPIPGASSEIDIEGLDIDGGYLWVIGSHSLKRKKPEDGKSPEENRKRLQKVEGDGNRYTLARVPLENGVPVRESGGLRAALLKGNKTGSVLSRALAEDDHIGPFCLIPSKDNGVDVEGLAICGERVFVGLRGPVLRGWAVLLELQLEESEPGVLRLAKPLRKHFLQLDGLGIRELAVDGSDLYVLGGPTMVLDGPVLLYRWPGAVDNTVEAIVPRAKLQRLLEIPCGAGNDAGRDHAEGITMLKTPGSGTRVMVCYDSPADSRLDGDDGVRIDVFDLGGGEV